MNTQPSFDHDALSNVLARLDGLDQIMSPRVGPWSAWPMCRYAVWSVFYWRLGGTQSTLRTLGFWSTFAKRLRQINSAITALAVGVSAFLRTIPTRDEKNILVLGTFSLNDQPDGSRSDYLFDDFLSAGAKSLPLPLSALDFRWSNTGQVSIFPSEEGLNIRSGVPGIYLGYVLSIVIQYTKMVRNAADQLCTIVTPHLDEISEAALRKMFCKHLAIFEANRMLYRYYLKRKRVQLLIITNPGGKWGEIAAAKELGIPVLELQHGALSPDTPVYNYPSQYRAQVKSMAIPDKVLVFGAAWKDILIKRGFWGEENIEVTGIGGIDAHRTAAPSRVPDASRPVRILYTSQGDSHVHAMEFLNEFLNSAGERLNGNVKLHVRPHPLENNSQNEFDKLQARHKGQVKILDTNQSLRDEIKEADFVVSYHSTALSEALALGVPAISICGGKSPLGFAGVVKIDGLGEHMKHVSDVAGMVDFIEQNIPGSSAYNDLCKRSLDYGEQLYARDFKIHFKDSIQRALKMVSS